MASSGRKDSKRIEAARRLEEAGKLLAEAGRKMTAAARALQLIEEAERRVTKAARIAEATTIPAAEMEREKPKRKHDGLPAGVRRKIATQEKRLHGLAKEVRIIPITREQVALARANRHKAAEGGGHGA